MPVAWSGAARTTCVRSEALAPSTADNGACCCPFALSCTACEPAAGRTIGDTKVPMASATSSVATQARMSI